jgi:type IV secretory pathway VirB2 component (pilin)
MSRPRPRFRRFILRTQSCRVFRHPAATYAFVLAAIALLYPIQAHASPFDTGFNNLQTLFTGTIAKVASIIAIVLGGIGFATGEPGAKKNLAGVAIGIGIATLAVNILSWLWGS